LLFYRSVLGQMDDVEQKVSESASYNYEFWFSYFFFS